MYQAGENIPDWFSNIIGAAIGALIAILGSVLIQIASQSQKNKKALEIQLSLLNKEIYDNFMVCLYRIKNTSSDIPYFHNMYDKLTSNGTTATNNKEFQEALSDLYFLIKRGTYSKKTYNSFYEDVFKKQKAPANFKDVREIIECVGVDQVYEFAILQQIVFLNKHFKLNLNLPYDDFVKVLEYDASIQRNFQDDTKNYIAELICRQVFSDDRILHVLKKV
ncbi:hypothetical protein [Desulfuribacillus alkaliarsenatis]|nr:hypothetical protein [Desulfuribacillus alkaliarsenatis]